MSQLLALLQRKLSKDGWRLTLREDGSGVIEEVRDGEYGIDWYITLYFDTYSELENWLTIYQG